MELHQAVVLLLATLAPLSGGAASDTSQVVSKDNSSEEAVLIVLQGLASQVEALTNRVEQLQAAVSRVATERDEKPKMAASCATPHPLGWSSRPPKSSPVMVDAKGLIVPLSDALLPRSLSPSSKRAHIPGHLEARHLLSGSVAGAESNFDTSPRLSRTEGVKKICVFEWQPIVTCPTEDESAFGGYMVDAFRRMAEDLGWSADSWYFECFADLPDLWADMLSDDGTCFMAAHGSQIVQSWLDAGIKFSAPTHRAGYQVLVRGTASNPDMFAMFQVFGWDIWLMLGITSILVSIVILLMDGAPRSISSKAFRNSVIPAASSTAAPSEDGEVEPQAWYESLASMTYDNLGLLVATGGPEGTSCPARFVILAYGLLVVLILALFTANTAAYVTTKALSSSIQGIKDLPNRKVAALGPMVDNLINNYDIKKSDIKSLPTSFWVDDFWSLLENGEVEALILPDHSAEYTASVKCETFVAGGLFNQVYLAFAFPPDAPDIDVYAFSDNLIALDERDGMLENLKKTYIDNENSTCGEAQFSETDTVMFNQVAGLWVILAVATYVSTMYILLRWVILGTKDCCRKTTIPSSMDENLSAQSGSQKAPKSAVPLLLSTEPPPPQSAMPIAQPALAPHGVHQPTGNSVAVLSQEFHGASQSQTFQGPTNTEMMTPKEISLPSARPMSARLPSSASSPHRTAMLPPL